MDNIATSKIFEYVCISAFILIVKKIIEGGQQEEFVKNDEGQNIYSLAECLEALVPRKIQLWYANVDKNTSLE